MKDQRLSLRGRTVLLFFISCLLLSSLTLTAQPWLRNQTARPNFYELKSQFETFMQGRDVTVKGQGYKQFKRWEWYWKDRVLPDGSFPEAGKNLKEFSAYRLLQQQNRSVYGAPLTEIQTSDWTSIAQTGSGGGYDGTGRVNCVAFHPTDPNIFFVGTPGGGIWKTTNGGSTWLPISETITQTGVTAIVVDPSNANTIYIGTGDGYGNLDVKGIGILKSTDGGATWQNTGLSWITSQQYVVSAMAMNPASTSTLIAATNAGLFRTTDGGSTWTLVRSGRHQDVKYQPGSGSTVYVTTGSPANIYKSTDGGSTWAQVTTLTGVNRINIAVTPANTTVVAAIASRSSDNGFEGVYYSTNSGASFTKRASTPNLLGWNANGGDAGGQGWYDLCIAIAPTDANKIFVGGVNTWTSSNGGTNWTLNTHWSGASGVSTVHADKHFIAFHPLLANTLFQCNDGGIYKSANNGTSWSDITTGLAITMYYRIATAQTNTAAMMGGAQDNGGRKRSTTGAWSMATGGDGMDVAVDPTNVNTMYSSYANGVIYRSSDQFVSNQVTISNNIAATDRNGGWLSPYTLDPNNSSIIYLGYRDVHRSTNQGTAWTKISTGLSATALTEVAVSKSSPATIVATNGTALYRTVNTGGSWATVTPTGLNGSRMTYIAIHPQDHNVMWVTLSGYNTGNKVLKTTNGGTSWTNVSGSLPNVPINCIVYDAGGQNDALYIGGDIGVYYRDNTMSDWAYFNNGLPNCEVISLDIQYSSRKLRAGTWGRGVWEVDAYASAAACNAPGGLVSSNITTNAATISWTTVSGASSYNVEYKPSASSTWTAAATATTSTSVSISGLAENTVYDWRVRTNCSSSGSSFTAAQFTTATAPCDAPSGLTSSAITASSATVTWATASGANSYDVEYKTSASSTWTTAATATTATSINLSGLVASTVYDWRVRGNCASANSSYSSAQLTTQSAPCNAPASLVSSNITATAATVGWATVSGATSYSVDYKTTASSTWINAASATTSTSIALSGLTASTAYDWRVRATCASTNSAYSTAAFTTPAATGCSSTYDAGNNSTRAAAVQVPFNSDVKGLINPSGDNDYYKFVVTTGGTITITLGTLPADYDIRLYNNAGTQVAISQNSNTTAETINYTAAAGTYSVRVYGYNNITNATVCYTLRVATGTASVMPVETVSNVGVFKVSIFPNPAGSTLNVNIAGDAAKPVIHLFDAAGRAVMNRSASRGTNALNLQRLARGVYMVKITDIDGKMIYQSKFIKE